MSQNPFLTAFENKGFHSPDEVIPFPSIKVEHYLPALEKSMQLARTNIAAIKANKAEPGFENVMEALETSTEAFDLVTNVYFNMFSAEASAELQALAAEISPKATELQSEISLDEEIFKKIKAVYDKRASLKLSQEQMQMLEKSYKNFVRNGALLDGEKKEKLKAIDQELSLLNPKFSENVLKATNAYTLWIDNAKDLAGLPEGAVEAAALEAEKKGQKGKWAFTLQAPSFLPFMQYAENRELRQQLWTAYSSRAFKGEFDNSDVVVKTVALRDERAKLLGFASHADFVLEERMAKTPAQVFAFLNQLMLPSKKAAEKDLAELREFKKSISTDAGDLQPWDTAFYSEKLKEKKYQFNEEELRPYFQLEKVVAGVFEHARQLYGLTFKKRPDVPVYHPEVEVFEVRDESSGDYVGLFYTDFFPRETKRGGAWMTVFREQGLWLGQVRRPHVSIVCNFTKPTTTKPSLLTYDEVQTLFHEFGHALHGLLSQCQYRSVAGTNVYWDFVELPSQIMENWVREKEGLDLFAAHYQTGAKIPADLVEKIKRANKFQSGLMSLRQVNFAMLDMKWHSTPPAQIKDISSFEEQATKDTRLFPVVAGTNSSAAFSHIFAGGYSAGYYSYKWAEVLDADAFEYFLDEGLFNAEVSGKFKKFVLSRGGTEHPMELYKKFRGREPDPNALLRRDGLTDVQ
ncbi:MAG: M3 family metallopeptidase [Bdellovibrionaceae bacterium]|nr:M3 family metallopeptidase [Pseudobdellovibrionaceae bacterium]